MLQVKNYENGNEIEIINLFKKAFNRSISLEEWKWCYNNDNKYIKLMWDGKILAGHYAIIPIKFKVYDKFDEVGLSMTTMTSPDYKKRGIFVMLAEELYMKNYNKLPFIYGFPNNNSIHGFTKYLKWKHIVDIIMYRCCTYALDIKSVSNNINFVTDFDDKFDKLFDNVKNRYGIICCRNKEYLNWRYKYSPRNKYFCFVYKINNSYLGYCVYKLYNDGDFIYCDLVDIISVNDEIFTYLINYLINFMHNEGIKSINFWNNDSKYLEIAEKLGFQKTNMITHFGVRINSDFLDEKVQDFSKWYITMGDSDVF